MEKQKKTLSWREPWFYASILTSLTGASLSFYSVILHRQAKSLGSDLSCNVNQIINCEKAIDSAFSEFLSVPLGVWGIGFFLSLILIQALHLTNEENREEHALGYLGLTFSGSAVSLFLITIGIFKLKSLCLNCLAIHFTNFIQLGICYWGWKTRRISFVYSCKKSMSGLSTSLVVISLVLITNNIIGEKKTIEEPKKASVNNNIINTSNTKNITISINQYSKEGGEDYRTGPDNALVTIVVFSDFQCPACQNMSELLSKTKKKYTEKINIVFKNYPLDKKCNSSMRRQMHRFACEIATTARCAGIYGYFWKYHDIVFKNQQEINEEKIVALALKSGLSRENIKDCQNDPQIMTKIKNDIKQGNSLNVTGTPAVFVNGNLWKPNVISLDNAIAKELE